MNLWNARLYRTAETRIATECIMQVWMNVKIHIYTRVVDGVTAATATIEPCVLYNQLPLRYCNFHRELEKTVSSASSDKHGHVVLCVFVHAEQDRCDVCTQENIHIRKCNVWSIGAGGDEFDGRAGCWLAWDCQYQAVCGMDLFRRHRRRQKICVCGSTMSLSWPSYMLPSMAAATVNESSTLAWVIVYSLVFRLQCSHLGISLPY